MVQSISAERTLVLPEYTGQTPGMSWPLIWPAKDPGDANMDFSLDVSGWLTEIQDTIGSFVVDWSPTQNPTDLVIPSAFSHNGICTILTNAGIPFTAYKVTLKITSAILGEVLSRTVTLPVEYRYGNAPAVSNGVSGVVSGVVQ